MGHTHRYKFGFEKKIGKESQYIVSCPELGSDPPFRSGRESGCDKLHYLQNITFTFYYNKTNSGTYIRKNLIVVLALTNTGYC